MSFFYENSAFVIWNSKEWINSLRRKRHFVHGVSIHSIIRTDGGAFAGSACRRWICLLLNSIRWRVESRSASLGGGAEASVQASKVISESDAGMVRTTTSGAAYLDFNDQIIRFKRMCLIPFDVEDTLDDRHRVRMGLNQLFQTKRSNQARRLGRLISTHTIWWMSLRIIRLIVFMQMLVWHLRMMACGWIGGIGRS